MRKKWKDFRPLGWESTGCYSMMRLFLCLFLLIATSNVWAQKADRVSINMKQTSLENVIWSLEKKTDIKFFYEVADVKNIKVVNVSYSNARLTDILAGVLRGTGLTYEMQNGVMVIKKDPNAQRTIGQVRTGTRIKGVVVDNTGEVLPGATVRVKGSGKDNRFIGTTTDMDGQFELGVNADDVTLIVSYVGMKSREVKYKGSGTMKIVLESDVAALEDVVVTGYNTVRKNSFTGSTTQVAKEDILKVSTNNVLEALQVFDPSMRLVKNNTMGSDPNTMPEFYVRGRSGIGTTELDQMSTGTVSRFSLLNNPNLPIFIMDGFEVSVEKVYDYDINRIKNITILKDAAATAMYGSRASNGVIVIETIAPAAGKLRVSYNTNISFTAPDLSSYDMMNAKEALEAERLAGLYDYDPYDSSSAVSQWSVKGAYYNQKANLIARGVDNYWLSQPLRTDINQTHSANIEAGSDNVRFSIDLRYKNQNGVMKGSYRDGYTGGFTLDYLTKHFQLRNNFQFTLSRSQDSPYGSFSDYSRRHPYDRWYDDDGNYVTTLPMWGALGSTISNPLYEATLGSYSKSGYKDFTNNVSVNWIITDALQIKGQFAMTYNLADTDRFKDPASPQFGTMGDLFNNGTKDVSNTDRFGWNLNLFGAYNKSINRHNINVSAGINMKEDKSTVSSSSYKGFPDAVRHQIAYANQIVSKPVYSDNITRLMGAFTTMNYSFRDIYLADFSFRADGSSEFGSDRKWGPFWSTGVGLNMHNYQFIKEKKFFDNLRVKATYGQTGKVNFSPYAAQHAFDIKTDYWYPTGIGASLKAMGNEDLTWEKTHTLDLGFEIGFLKAYNVKFNWYNRKTVDLITDIALPASAGFTSYKSNGGEIQNRGYEIMLNAKAFSNRDWDIRLFANIAHNSNKILKLSEELQAYNDRVDSYYKNYRTSASNLALANLLNDTDYNQQYSKPVMKYEVGSSLTSIYGMKSLGINPADGEEIYEKRDGTITREWSTYEQQKIGDTEPEISGSFGINVSWKQFSLYTSFLYEFGGDRYNQTLVDNVENVNLLRYNADRRVLTERWTKPGDVTSLKSLKDRFYVTRPTSRFVQKDNTVTLNSISLSYDFDRSLIRKFGCQMLRLQLNMNDIFYISSIKRELGLDYPYARTYTFTLSTIF